MLVFQYCFCTPTYERHGLLELIGSVFFYHGWVLCANQVYCAMAFQNTSYFVGEKAETTALFCAAMAACRSTVLHSAGQSTFIHNSRWSLLLFITHARRVQSQELDLVLFKASRIRPRVSTGQMQSSGLVLAKLILFRFTLAVCCLEFALVWHSAVRIRREKAFEFIGLMYNLQHLC